MDDRERFEHLYRAHAGAVRSYAYRRTDPQMADDAVAEVFAVVWRRLDDVPRDPLPWLLGVARRVLANQHRGAARRQALTDRLARERPGEPREVIGGAGDDAVLRALAAIGERDREALLLGGWEGLSASQAAAALGLRANTFAARFSRARQRFAQALSDAEGRPDHETTLHEMRPCDD